jgi:Na+/alanine symporter
MTLGAVLFSATYGLWVMVKLHQLSMIVMVIINLMLFLYLVRPEVRQRLK